jgi:hypothetical protein
VNAHQQISMTPLVPSLYSACAKCITELVVEALTKFSA